MKKQLIDLYKQYKEADDFIQAHLAEFSEESYNDITHINPSILRLKDVSVIIKNLHLLKNSRHKNMLQDYFNKMSLTDLQVKYNYKSIDSTKDTIKRLKKLVKKRFNALVNQQLSLELKKVSDDELKENKIREITLNLTNKQISVFLVKVKFKNKLMYKFHDEDVASLYEKSELIVDSLTVMEKPKVKKALNKYTKDDLTFYYFEQMNQIIERYRWVTSDGFFLPKVLDDAITQIMNHQYSDKKNDELFQ